MKFSKLLAAALLLAAVAIGQGAGPDAAVVSFEDPVQLTTAGALFEGMLYPSPVLHDIDGDRRRELVIGDLRGFLWICNPDGEGTDLAWREKAKLESGGKPLKLHNW